MTEAKTSEINYGIPREVKFLRPRLGWDVDGDMDLCQEEKLTGRESRKDGRVFYKVVRRRGRKSEAGIFNNDIVEKNLAEVARISAVSSPNIPTTLG